MNARRFLLLAVTHAVTAGIGFAGGVYFLPILIAPPAPSAAEAKAAASGAQYTAQFRRGFISYGADVGALIERSAWYVDRISKGARLAELPMEQPTKFELVVNLGTAKALGITIPQSILLRADRVIQ